MKARLCMWGPCSLSSHDTESTYPYQMIINLSDDWIVLFSDSREHIDTLAPCLLPRLAVDKLPVDERVVRYQAPGVVSHSLTHYMS